MNLNVCPPSHLPIDQIQEDHDQAHHLHPFGMDHHMISSSPSSVLCRDFFNSTQDHTDYYHHKLYQSQLRHGGQSYAYNQGGSTAYEFKNKVENSGLKLTLWKKETDNHHQGSVVEKDYTQGKWISAKTNDRVVIKIKTKFDDHCQNKLQSSSSLGSDGSSNSSSINNNSLIRVCADCKTTKTPLWRSGPQGPKSLCNACGIRQRKARRAMAAATISNSATIATNEAPTSMKIKLPQKEKHTRINERHDLPVKKRCRFGVGSQNKRSDLEDFLIKLSKSINLHSVFPEDEKDAAILLMALSSGLVHG